jgi:hypothetical protein
VQALESQPCSGAPVETHRAHRLKQGGQYQFVSLDLETAEDRYRYEPADHLTAEKIFEARWG